MTLSSKGPVRIHARFQGRIREISYDNALKQFTLVLSGPPQVRRSSFAHATLGADVEIIVKDRSYPDRSVMFDLALEGEIVVQRNQRARNLIRAIRLRANHVFVSREPDENAMRRHDALHALADRIEKKYPKGKS